MPKGNSPGAGAIEVPDAAALLITAESALGLTSPAIVPGTGRRKIFSTRTWAMVMFVCMLLIALGIGVGLYFSAKSIPIGDQESTFQTNILNECQSRMRNVALEMKLILDTIQDHVALVYSTPNFTEASFAAFTSVSAINSVALRSFTYADAVSEDQRPAWEKQNNAAIYELTAFPNGSIDTSKPAFNASTSPLPFYLPLTYRYYPRNVSTSSISTTKGSDTLRIRQPQVTRALRTRRGVLSSPVVLANGNTELGFAYIAPIYYQNASLEALPNITNVYDPAGWAGLRGILILVFPSSTFFSAYLVGNVTVDANGSVLNAPDGGLFISVSRNKQTAPLASRLRLTMYDTSDRSISGINVIYEAKENTGELVYGRPKLDAGSYYNENVSGVDIGTTVLIVFSVTGMLVACFAAYLVVRFFRARKRTKNMIEALYTDSKAIVKAIPDPLVALDDSGRIIGANKAALDATGYSSEDIGNLYGSDLLIISDGALQGKEKQGQLGSTGSLKRRIASGSSVKLDSTVSSIPGVHVPSQLLSANGALESRPSYNKQGTSINSPRTISVSRKDGTHFPAEASFSQGVLLDDESDVSDRPVTNEQRGGMVSRLWSMLGIHYADSGQHNNTRLRRFARVVVFRDVTEKHEKDQALRAALERAEEADRRTERVLRFLCHELRNPVHAIVGYSHLILDEDEGHEMGDISYPPNRIEELQSIAKAGSHIASLVSDVLLYTDLQRDQIQLHDTEVDMKRLLGGSWRGGTVKVLGRWLDTEVRFFVGDYGRIRDAIRKMVDYAVLTLGDVGGDVQVEGRILRDSSTAALVEATSAVEVSISSARRSTSGDGSESLSSGRDSYIQNLPTPGSSSSNPFESGTSAYHVSPLLAALERDPFQEQGSSTGKNFGASGIWLAVSRSLSERMGGGLNMQENGDGSIRAVLTFALKRGRESRPRFVRDVEFSTIHPHATAPLEGQSNPDSIGIVRPLDPLASLRPPSPADGLRPSPEVISTLVMPASQLACSTNSFMSAEGRRNTENAGQSDQLTLLERVVAPPSLETLMQPESSPVTSVAPLPIDEKPLNGGGTSQDGNLLVPEMPCDGSQELRHSGWEHFHGHCVDAKTPESLSTLTPAPDELAIGEAVKLLTSSSGMSAVAKADDPRQPVSTVDSVTLGSCAPVADVVSTPKLVFQPFKPKKITKTAPRVVDVGELSPPMGHILLAEDNIVVAKVTAKMLMRNGFRVDIAEDGLKCVERIKSCAKDTYDVVLMDILMPNLDGIGAAQQLREMGFDRAIVAVTAYSGQDDERKYLDNRLMQAMLGKPVKEQDLLDTVSKLMKWRKR
ncbi:hypothetical protein HDU93_000122 [Gonapodya sp. JEL0774]|nr:hypothetical protein HDU93_000122 [Gonapodya sp. JEL0774]